MADEIKKLERHAARTVHGVVDKMRQYDTVHGRRQRYAIIIIVGLVVIWGIFMGLGMWEIGRRTPKAEDTACELQAWTARAAAFEREVRAKDPSMAYRDIQARLEEERPALMAAAKAECAHKSK